MFPSRVLAVVLAAAATSLAQGSKGDTQCVPLMCITAQVNGSTVQCTRSKLLDENTVKIVSQIHSRALARKKWLGWPCTSSCGFEVDGSNAAHRGFGATMANSPMVLMWPNADSSITLSQRMAPAEVQPRPVDSPPRKATLNDKLSVVSSSSP